MDQKHAPSVSPEHCLWTCGRAKWLGEAAAVGVATGEAAAGAGGAAGGGAATVGGDKFSFARILADTLQLAHMYEVVVKHKLVQEMYLNT